MTYTPRFIIYLAVVKYLNKDQIEDLKKELGESGLKQDRKFLSIIKKYFDFEVFKDKPMLWQDIWIYNYLRYEVKLRLPRRGLIAKYEKEVIIPFKMFLAELNELMNKV
jgi:hypothetical protein